MTLSLRVHGNCVHMHPSAFADWKTHVQYVVELVVCVVNIWD